MADMRSELLSNVLTWLPAVIFLAIYFLTVRGYRTRYNAQLAYMNGLLAEQKRHNAVLEQILSEIRHETAS